MATVVIGGQASGVGKTGVICALMRAMPERRWTAIKITQCSHRDEDARRCDCELGGAPFAISEEHDANRRGDSSRYLAAGAERSLWVRTLPGHLTMPRVREEMERASDVIFESNSVLEFVEPDIYALVATPCIADFKPSARMFLGRADAVLMASPPPGHSVRRPVWMRELRDVLARIPQFEIAVGQLMPQGFLELVRERLVRQD